MTSWLTATLFGALFQAWRTAVQQRVRAQLSVNAAGLARYLFGLPVSIALLLTYAAYRGFGWPEIGAAVLGFAILAAIAQIIGTNLLLMAFGYRNFVVGTAYAKTEAIQGAVLAFILLGERLSWISLCGIAIGVAGVLAISTGTTRLRLRDLTQPAALCGLGAGFFLTMTSIFVKAASVRLNGGDLVFEALLILVIVQACQTLLQGAYVVWRERDQVRPLFSSWRTSGQVGLLAALGSACWFTAFASAPVALVRAVGQIEVLFTFAFGRWYLKEAVRPQEILGLALVGLGVIITLIGY